MSGKEILEYITAKKYSSILILLVFLLVVILSVAKAPEQGALADRDADDGQTETCSEEPGQTVEEQLQTSAQEETFPVIRETENQAVDKNTLSIGLNHVPPENLWEMDLSEEEKQLLEEHVFGDWIFVERLFPVDEYQGEEEIEANFSEQGVEAMKNMVISYGKERVEGFNFTQRSFRDSKDLFLFILYGGANEVVLPVYHVFYKVDVEDIKLHNHSAREMTHIRIQEKETLIEVRYDLGDLTVINPYVMVDYLGSALYIDPNDTETLYMDFCGLWKLERFTWI